MPPGRSRQPYHRITTFIDEVVIVRIERFAARKRFQAKSAYGNQRSEFERFEEIKAVSQHNGFHCLLSFRHIVKKIEALHDPTHS